MTIGRESVTAVECLGLGVVGIDHDIGPSRCIPAQANPKT
jgi:hypothetical protein